MNPTSSLRVMVVLASMLCLRAMGWGDEKTAAKCCDTSSTECKTGQSVGDKGSCPGSQVCVQIADKCSKKHPGVFCSCGDKQSSLEVITTKLTFDKKSRKGSLTVSNAGNVPLDITIVESGDTDTFAVQETRKCKKKRVSPAERQEFRALLAPTSTAIVPPEGCINWRVRFTAKKKGFYSLQLVIESDATTPPTGGSVALIGSIGRPGTGSNTTTTLTSSTTSTTYCAALGQGCGMGAGCCSPFVCGDADECCTGVGESCNIIGSTCCPGTDCVSGTCRAPGCGMNHTVCTGTTDCCPGYICFKDSDGNSNRCCSDSSCSVDADCCYQSTCTNHVCG